MNKNKGRWPYISLALAVLASFVLACDPPNTPTDPPPVVPAFPMRAVHVGMREFMVETQGGEGIVSFIASRSAAPLAWADIAKNPALMTRKLGKDKGNRFIYFSITDKYDPKLPIRVLGSSGTYLAANIDISQRTTAGQTEADYMATVAPGIMVPNTNYYVYAYQDAAFLGTSPAIKTIARPADADIPQPLASGDLRNGPGGTPSLIGHLWGMDAWKRDKTDPEADTKLRTIELKTSETSFFPMRLAWPAWSPTNCHFSGFIKTTAIEGSNTVTLVGSLRGLTDDTPVATGWYAFSRQLPSNLSYVVSELFIPVMFPPSGTRGIPEYTTKGIETRAECFDLNTGATNPDLEKFMSWDITPITE